MEPYHLHRYVKEQAFRYNERFGKDAHRFASVLRAIVDGRITPDMLYLRLLSQKCQGNGRPAQP